MIRLLPTIMLALALLLGQPSGATAQPTGTAPETAAAHSRQLLVLLPMPAPHFRAGRDYGGSYGDGPARAARRRLAGSLADRAGVRLVEGWPMPLIGVDCFVVEVPLDRSLPDAAAALAAMPGVAWVQPVQGFTARAGSATTPDPLFLAQPATAQWHLADLHRVADGKGVRVAVIDSKVDARHPDLAGQVVRADNFVGPAAAAEQHGTAVAGIIAAVAGNGIGIAGIAPGADILAFRACWERPAPSATVCNSLSLAKALHQAVQSRAAIVNLSLGGPEDPLLGRLLDVALDRGIAVVAAVDPDAPNGGFPASHPGVIAVAGTAPPGQTGRVYLAPAKDIPTTQGGGRWTLVNGSSFAAAHVSGLLALMRSAPTPPQRDQLVSATRAGGAIDSCASLGAGKSCGCPSTGQAPSKRCQ